MELDRFKVTFACGHKGLQAALDQKRASYYAEAIDCPECRAAWKAAHVAVGLRHYAQCGHSVEGEYDPLETDAGLSTYRDQPGLCPACWSEDRERRDRERLASGPSDEEWASSGHGKAWGTGD